MARLIINTFSDPLYTMRVPLDGAEYIFDFDYNGREGRWYFGLSVSSGPLARGIKVVPNIDLLERYQDPLLPPGVLIALALKDEDNDAPTLFTLGRGKNVTLYYYDTTSE